MVWFGVEGIRYFDKARATGQIKKAADMTYTFNLCNGMDRELREAGHYRDFYWANENCWEIDLRSESFGGIDHKYADRADLFFIVTHGRHEKGNAYLLYNIKIHKWQATSAEWRLGDNYFCEWLMVYGCQTIDINNAASFKEIFQKLHEFCGGWGDMWDAWTTEECGEDVGDYLTDGDTVAEAWIDGLWDWALDNHPVVLAMERKETWDGGKNINWSKTTMNTDHVPPHGLMVADIYPKDRYWMSVYYSEG